MTLTGTCLKLLLLWTCQPNRNTFACALHLFVNYLFTFLFYKLSKCTSFFNIQIYIMHVWVSLFYTFCTVLQTEGKVFLHFLLQYKFKCKHKYIFITSRHNFVPSSFTIPKQLYFKFKRSYAQCPLNLSQKVNFSPVKSSAETNAKRPTKTPSRHLITWK